MERLDQIASLIHAKGARHDNTRCKVLSRGDAVITWHISEWPLTGDMEYCVVDVHFIKQSRAQSEQDLTYIKNKLKDLSS